MISPELIGRLRSRAADHRTRTDAPTLNGGTSFGGGQFRTVRVALGGGISPDPPSLAPPASAEQIAAAEARLGFSLPDDLKLLYGEVANGGFGPGDGLAALSEAVERYLRLLANPPGEEGQRWPENLLPINLTEPGADCCDLKSGQIIYWDEESLADGPGDRIWKRSFKKQAKSLGAWLEFWLSRPPVGDQLVEFEEQDQGETFERNEEALREGLRSTIAYWRARTPEERAAFGMPEVGWEEAFFEHFGIDPKDL